jgi:hypothetical protein
VDSSYFGVDTPKALSSTTVLSQALECVKFTIQLQTGSHSVLNAATIVVSEKKHVVPMQSNYTYNCPVIAVSELELWKAVAQKPSNGRVPKFHLKVQKVCAID